MAFERFQPVAKVNIFIQGEATKSEQTMIGTL